MCPHTEVSDLVTFQVGTILTRELSSPLVIFGFILFTFIRGFLRLV